MTEGEKKKIYYNLRTNNVIVEKQHNCTLYTFGRYRVNNYFDHIYISKGNNKFIIMKDMYWDDDYPKNDVYAIAVAVKNKANKKEYIDPYKDRPTDIEIKDLTKRFSAEISKISDEFLPVDMPEKEALKTIKEMKLFLARKLKRYYTK